MACVAYGCKSRSSRKSYGQSDKNLSFHRFPADKKLKDVWVTAVQRKNWKPSKYSRLCSKHFESKSYLDGKKRKVLCRDAVPTIFKSYPTYLQKVAASTDAKTQTRYTDEENTSIIIECRACLQILDKDSVLYNIFEKWTPSWDGMGKNIAKDLAKLANVQILETDEHSKIICATCCQLLLSACNFTALVKNNDQILRQRHQGDTTELDSLNKRVWPKPIQVDKSLTTALYENHMDVEIKQEVVSEDEYHTINGTYDTPKEEIPNLDIVKVEPEEMIQQQPLRKPVTVNGKKSLKDRIHIKSSTSVTLPLQYKKKVNELICALCGETFTDDYYMKIHQDIHHSNIEENVDGSDKYNIKSTGDTTE